MCIKLRMIEGYKRDSIIRTNYMLHTKKRNGEKEEVEQNKNTHVK
jgi:hypothetical protein